MKWRCTWCGKPHESNDPPCDTCGHGQFEEAIVRETEFETVDTGTEYIWVCSNCGRQHVKNNPPCARCGSHDLEKTEPSYDVGDDLDVPSWFDVAKPYAPVFLVFAIVLGLFVTGVVSPSIIPGIGTPSVSDVPGDGAHAAGFDLEELESGVHDRLEAEREAAGSESRAYDGGLAGIAEYGNHQDVVEWYEGERPDDPNWGEFDPTCAGTTFESWQVGPLEGDIDAYGSEDELATAVTEAILDAEEGAVLESAYVSEGVDVHAGPDGTVFVRYAVC